MMISNKKPGAVPKSLKWSETWKFVAARNKDKNAEKHYKQRFIFGMVLLVFIVVIWGISGAKPSFTSVLAVGLLLGLFSAFPMYWLISYTPKKITVTHDFVRIDMDTILNDQIVFAEIDEVLIANNIYSTFHIRDVQGKSWVVGVPNAEVGLKIHQFFDKTEVKFRVKRE